MPQLTPEARAKLADYLRTQQALGVERLRVAAAGLIGAAPAAPVATAAGESLPQIQADLGGDCRRCKLHRLGRRQVVFGEGNPHAELVFVGEAPGADEDAQGRPFVGRGGQLLNDMIQKGMGLRREQVYICNVNKCRPPENRTPETDEIAACSPFLLRQLLAVQPRVI
ncbi:MAG: uracil-DNA glycosylase, partial [Terriglobales bacterium]